jgi:hypothetical protein
LQRGAERRPRRDVRDRVLFQPGTFLLPRSCPQTIENLCQGYRSLLSLRMTRPPLANCNTLSNVSLYIGEPWTHVQLELLNEGAFIIYLQYFFPSHATDGCSISWLVSWLFASQLHRASPFVALAACSSAGRMRWSDSAAGSLTHRRGAASGLFGAAAVRELPHGTRQHGDMGTPEKKGLIHTNTI